MEGHKLNGRDRSQPKQNKNTENIQQQTSQNISRNQYTGYKPLKIIDEFHETKKSIFYSQARQIATEEKRQKENTELYKSFQIFIHYKI